MKLDYDTVREGKMKELAEMLLDTTSNLHMTIESHFKGYLIDDALAYLKENKIYKCPHCRVWHTLDEY